MALFRSSGVIPDPGGSWPAVSPKPTRFVREGDGRSTAVVLNCGMFRQGAGNPQGASKPPSPFASGIIIRHHHHHHHHHH
eukprot:CAMPEP_0182526422 /NCGR_PEP_ID=MMETSP1323-20130603/3178_1 /TAXON_ID=236787 /ORGANISM="Florenciella parvula, Strain RCC1693" /LENGTH=79 /DNA_ID=CAMNT_0024735275 /DNA_START=15 /DNA_END=251 /DNA_ORIENTATION=+